MDIISKAEFLDLEKYNINVLGIKKEVIIENASIKFIKNINLNIRETFAVVCGNGDNGSYGLAIARNLISYGKNVDIYIIKHSEDSSIDFLKQLEIIKNIGIKVNNLETIEELENFSNDIRKVNTIVDAIIGIDYRSNFFGTVEYIINLINVSGIYTMSVDLPSGVDYDTGISKVQYIQADMIVTFHKKKKVLLKNNNFYNIKIVVENIGLIERK